MEGGITEEARGDPFVGLDHPLPPAVALGYGLQHVLAMFVGIVTPPIVVGGAIGLPQDQLAQLISTALLVSGINTFVQVRRIGPLGSGLLSVQGTSFTFVPVAIQAGRAGGLPLVLGSALAAAPVEMIVSRVIPTARRLFPPLVTGTVVMLIGLNLIGVGMADLAGGRAATDPGAPRHLALGALVLGTILAVHRLAPPRLRSAAVATGLGVGYLAALLTGRIDLSAVGSAPWLALPRPLSHGLALQPAFLLPFAVAYLVSALESVGDLTATSEVSREPVDGPLFTARLRGGLLADGTGSALAAVLGGLPNTTFSQNNGLIGLTGVASRRVGFAVAALLVALGLVPKLGALVGAMPPPVLGGATLLLFSTVAVSGMRIVARDGLGPRDQTIVAVSLGLGLGVTLVPGALVGFAAATPWAASARIVLGSGLAVGACAATLLNLFFRGGSAPS